MQTSQFIQKKTLWPLLPVAVAIIALLGISSCGGNEVRPLATPDNCITMSRNNIVNSWLDPGWNVPANANYISGIMFEPIAGNPFSVVAYPVDKNCTPLIGKKLNMTIGANCSLSQDLSLGKCRYDFVQGDADSENTLIYFNFLRLIQEPDPTDPTKLAFKVQFVTVKGGREVPLDRAATKPCPPYCPVN